MNTKLLKLLLLYVALFCIACIQPAFAIAPCDEAIIAMQNNQMVISNINAPHKQIDIYKINFGGGWESISKCNDTCGESTSIVVEPQQQYMVHIKLFSADWRTVCDKKINYTTTDIHQNTPLAIGFSPCADRFFYALRNLLVGVGAQMCGVAPHDSQDVFGEMTDGCYGGTDNTTGRVSFTMFKSANKRSTAPEFRPIRVIWGSKQSVYDYYGVCTPPNLVYELQGTENHIFEAVLVPVNVYKQSPNPSNRSYDEWKTKFSFPINAIASLQGVAVEPPTGYIATNEPANYSNTYSSKGILVRATLTNNKKMDFYLLNNYEGAGTIAWKQ
jgi:hypothetical protein